LSSAAGPKIMVWSLDLTGSYGAFFYASAALCALLTLGVWLVSFPNLAQASDELAETPSEASPVIGAAEVAAAE
jgi:hypothetical protein